MTIGFNAFIAPVSGTDFFGNEALIFPVTGITGVEMRLRVLPGTTYDPVTGTFDNATPGLPFGVIGYELFNVTNSFVMQTAELGAGLPNVGAGSLADLLHTFLNQSLSVIADTFTAWDIIGGTGPLGQPAGIGDPHFALDGSSLTFDLVNAGPIMQRRPD